MIPKGLQIFEYSFSIPIPEGYPLTTKGNKSAMSELTIKSRKSDITVKVEYSFPPTVADAVVKYGEDVVLNRFNRQVSQELRAVVSRQAENAVEAKAKGKDAPKGAEKNPQIAASKAAMAFKPTVTSGTSKAARTIDKALSGLTEEERALVLNALNASAVTDFSGLGDSLASD